MCLSLAPGKHKTPQKVQDHPGRHYWGGIAVNALYQALLNQWQVWLKPFYKTGDPYRS